MDHSEQSVQQTEHVFNFSKQQKDVWDGDVRNERLVARVCFMKYRRSRKKLKRDRRKIGMND
jgi:hypothetical protein